MDLCEQSPSYIRAIAPYQPGKPISELAREMGLDEKKIIKLASNENPLGVSPKARAAIKKALPELGRYPDGNAFELKAALSRRYGVPEECIVVGNGSNDLLEMAAGVFLAPGRAAVYSQHAFAVYPLATQARGAKSIVVPARNYGHDLPAMLAAITPETRVVFIANPNNPTGTFVPGGELEDFLSRTPRDVAVVVDEAYTEYLPPELRYDSVGWLKKYANLVLTRTFSKVYGLAGLGDKKFVAKSHKMNRAGMARLERAFKALGLEYIPSCANFVSFCVPRHGDKPRADRVYGKLLRQGVIVRPVSGYGMPDHLRVTVGTPKENEKFLKALDAALEA